MSLPGKPQEFDVPEPDLEPVTIPETVPGKPVEVPSEEPLVPA